ncbi:MAG: monomeric [Paludibacteraceae bacterium]|nr:monomeric [FeFe] hydrogenase [Paludibacteraceae bacterium]
MAFTNNVMIVRHGLLAKLVKLWKEDKLVEEIDELPIKLSPRQSKVRGRCCIHKERAVWKYKTFPLLGFDMSDEVSENTPLSHYAKEALARQERTKKNIMCVMDEACSSCVQTNYEISNLCRGCVARSCYMNCPKNAIHFKSNGQAEIDHDVCISCGICHQSCPYHAIIYVPVPCEEACPVKAITKDEHGVEHIDESKCIYCGKCINACPFGAIFEISQVFDILETIKNPNQKIVAMVAPAILSQFNTTLENLYGALKEIGFDDVIEVALGADETTRRESHELLEKLEEGQPFMTTSCCPSYIQLVKKHIPEMEKYVSTTLSPMRYTAEIAKEKYPDCKTVFIGPCIAKRKEAEYSDNVDFVMTFEELGSILDGMEINLEQVAPFQIDKEAYLTSHGYGSTGGVTKAVVDHLGGPEVNALLLSNLNKKNIGLLRAYAKSGKCPNQFIEVMACENGCISGPVTRIDKATAAKTYTKELAKMATERAKK